MRCNCLLLVGVLFRLFSSLFYYHCCCHRATIIAAARFLCRCWSLHCAMPTKHCSQHVSFSLPCLFFDGSERRCRLAHLRVTGHWFRCSSCCCELEWTEKLSLAPLFHPHRTPLVVAVLPGEGEVLVWLGNIFGKTSNQLGQASSSNQVDSIELVNSELVQSLFTISGDRSRWIWSVRFRFKSAQVSPRWSQAELICHFGFRPVDRNQTPLHQWAKPARSFLCT